MAASWCHHPPQMSRGLQVQHLLQALIRQDTPLADWIPLSGQEGLLCHRPGVYSCLRSRSKTGSHLRDQANRRGTMRRSAADPLQGTLLEDQDV